MTPLDEVDDESSLELVRRARAGEKEALERLCARYLPVMRRWASGRLPGWARGGLDTDDLVQESVIQTLGRLETFEPRREGALRAYLRQAVLNRIRDVVRRAQRQPPPSGLKGWEEAPVASPLEEAIGREAVERYEAALTRLRPEEREAIVARIEMACSYEEAAEALGKPSADAARMAICRALRRLAEEMGREG